VTGSGAAAAVDPVVWRVLALLMGLGGVLALVLGWRDHRGLKSRVRSLVGPGRSHGATADSSAPAPVIAPVTAPRWRLGRGSPGRRPEGPLHGRPVARHLCALGAAAGCKVVIDGLPGWLAAGTVGWLVWHRQRGGAPRAADDSATRAEARSVEHRLPLMAELVAACLTAGSTPAQAADAVGRSTGGPLGDRLVRAASELRLGAEPSAVWGRFGALPGCEELARCMERAGTAGVPPAQAVARLAAECRARRARAATARARRAAVLITGPLGLCFLPAFLAVGVAPVVIGLARSLL
jgi:Flp pilus assembly protein TadB